MTERRAARRAIVRWALRMFRRDWRQHVVVIALLSLATAAAVTMAAVAVTADSDAAGRFGSGHALVRLDDVGPRTPAALETIADRLGVVDVVAHASTVVPGSVQRLDVRDQDPNGAFSAPMIDLIDGRYPASAGEVALTADGLQLFDVALGGRVVIDRVEHVVVGEVENPSQLDDEFALVAPGTIESPQAYSVLVDHRAVDGVMRQGGLGVDRAGLMTAGTDGSAVAAIVIVVTTLAMSLVALIAAAAFVVLAQRRQRQLGLVGAIGATPRQVRSVMMCNGAFVGVVASCVGGIAGVLVWLAVAPAVERAANHRVDRFDLPWLLVGAVVLLCLVMSTLAAWWPARVASRQSIVASLSGRPVTPRPVHRSIVVALVFFAAGAAGLVAGNATAREPRPLALIGGVLAIVIGAVFTAPAAVRALGVLARRLPFAPRLALRDLARYQARAAASLAAITLGLGIAVSVIVIAATNEHDPNEGNLSPHEVLIRAGDPDVDATTSLTAEDTAALDRSAAAVVAALGPDLSSVPLDYAYAADAGDVATRAALPAGLGVPEDAHSIRSAGLPFVASRDVLALYGIDPASIGADIDVVTRRTETPLVLVVPPAMAGDADPERERPKFDADAAPVQRVALPPWSSAPNSLITEAGMRRHGLLSQRAAWIVESPDGFTSAQLRAARAAAAEVGLAIEVRDGQDALVAVRTWATIVGALLAMAVVAMTVGLIRGEASRDIRTMTACGAASRTRRAVTASTAGALAALGVLLGVGGAYAAIVAALHQDLDRLAPVPIANLLELGVGLPALAVAAGYALAGREPQSYARQALD